MKEVTVTGKVAAKGGLFVLGAKAFFIVIGLVQQALLPRFIGLAGYGALSRVLAVANVVNNVVVTGSTQGVSRAVARSQNQKNETLRAVLFMHAPLALVLGAAFFLVAPLVADFQRAPHIVWPLRVAAGVVLAYGLYAPLVGALNGLGRFGRQASLDVLFATLRTIGLIGLGALFVRTGRQGAFGAMLGFVFAAVVILAVAARWVGMGEPSSGAPALDKRAYMAGFARLALAQLLANLLMQVDITLLGRALSDGAEATFASLGQSEQLQRADEWVGVYRACQLFAFLPYQLLVSVTQVLFPMLSAAHGRGDRSEVRLLVERGTRIGVLLSGLFAAVIAAMPSSLIGFAYSADIAARGAPALRVLLWGQWAFAIMGLSSTVLASLGEELKVSMVNAVCLLLIGLGCLLAVPSVAFGGGQLVMTARVTSVSLGLGAIVMAVWTRRVSGGFAPMATLLRVALGVGLASFSGSYLPGLGRFTTLVAASGVAVMYLLWLGVTGEVGRAEWTWLRKRLSRTR